MPHTAAALTLAMAMVSTPVSTVKSTQPVSKAPVKQEISLPCADKTCVVDLISFYADAYDVDEDTALSVARCESEFKTTAVGDSGRAYGVYQFHEPTFREFAKKFGNEGLEYKSTEDSIQLAMWALANGKGNHWTCYRKITAADQKVASAK